MFITNFLRCKGKHSFVTDKLFVVLFHRIGSESELVRNTFFLIHVPNYPFLSVCRCGDDLIPSKRVLGNAFCRCSGAITDVEFGSTFRASRLACIVGFYPDVPLAFVWAAKVVCVIGCAACCRIYSADHQHAGIARPFVYGTRACDGFMIV